MGKTIAIIEDNPFAVEEEEEEVITPERMQEIYDKLIAKQHYQRDKIRELEADIGFLLFKKSPVESPIEEIMYQKLIYLKHQLVNNAGILKISVIPQAEVEVFKGKYRVDFLVKIEHQNPKYSKSFVVECDGHEWHEKTKKQAAKDKKRDREILMQGGYPVIHFTGSEITNDIEGCGVELFEYII